MADLIDRLLLRYLQRATRIKDAFFKEEPDLVTGCFEIFRCRMLMGGS